jgi:hypothetical protein
MDRGVTERDILEKKLCGVVYKVYEHSSCTPIVNQWQQKDNKWLTYVL